LQAVILNAKIKRLKSYEEARVQVANAYDAAFEHQKGLITPFRSCNSTHVFHQYTLRVIDGKRDALKKFLQEKGIPSMIYYPLPLHFQKAYSQNLKPGMDLSVSELLAKEVLSLPIHTEMDEVQLKFITETVLSFY
jgi:dTDP-4-amino-4,6-dideoxygalactose transaminase